MRCVVKVCVVQNTEFDCSSSRATPLLSRVREAASPSTHCSRLGQPQTAPEPRLKIGSLGPAAECMHCVRRSVQGNTWSSRKNRKPCDLDWIVNLNPANSFVLDAYVATSFLAAHKLDDIFHLNSKQHIKSRPKSWIGIKDQCWQFDKSNFFATFISEGKFIAKKQLQFVSVFFSLIIFLLYVWNVHM